MYRTLRVLAMVMGVACALIAVDHFAFGQASVPGAGPLNPTIDSRERFYSSIFLGFAIAWIWAARQPRLPIGVLRMLTAVFLLGGLGRVISWVQLGPPNWLQQAETALELLLPIVFFVLASAAAHARAPGLER